ncbi:amidohydrolase [Alicyclobacillus hesperidum subsp. aegles]|nr:amidohydrolase [Alicyclobacillus hesperidum subsp. aegles]
MNGDMGVLYKDYLPIDLEPELKKHNIHGSILVQAAPTYEETDFLLSLATRNQSILGVVGWMNPQDYEWERRIRDYMNHCKWVGFRLMIEYMEDLLVLLSEPCISMLNFCARNNISVDVLARVHQLPALIKLLERVPDLRVVLDHLAKPDVRQAELDPWLTYVRNLSNNPNVFVKLSGLVTEAGDKWLYTDFTPYIHYALEYFGTERVMFGSDWPVCLTAASYEQVIDIINSNIPNDFLQDGLWGENARRFYGIKSL